MRQSLSAGRAVQALREAGLEPPADVVDVLDGLTRLETAARQLASPSAPDAGPAASRVTEAALAGDVDLVELAVAGADELRAADAAIALHQHVAELLRRAHTGLDSAVENVLRDRADDIVAGLLRPALDELLEQAQASVAALDGREPTPAAVIDDDVARRALLELDRLGRQYAALRRAQYELGRLIDAQSFAHSVTFAELENVAQVWPGWAGLEQVVVAGRVESIGDDKPAPWPPLDNEPTEHLVWLVRSPAAPWLPTLDEQKDAARAARARRAATHPGIPFAPLPA